MPEPPYELPEPTQEFLDAVGMTAEEYEGFSQKGITVETAQAIDDQRREREEAAA
jgi:hypothetical protein